MPDEALSVLDSPANRKFIPQVAAASHRPGAGTVPEVRGGEKTPPPALSVHPTIPLGVVLVLLGALVFKPSWQSAAAVLVAVATVVVLCAIFWVPGFGFRVSG